MSEIEKLAEFMVYNSETEHSRMPKWSDCSDADKTLARIVARMMSESDEMQEAMKVSAVELIAWLRETKNMVIKERNELGEALNAVLAELDDSMMGISVDKNRVEWARSVSRRYVPTSDGTMYEKVKNGN